MMFSVQAPQIYSMLTRDGVRLDADVYLPVGKGPFPVLLMRQPYGRAIASTIVYAHPRWYAAHGYIVVIQDVRGRGTSAGDFCLFAHEVEDGEDTLAWAVHLPNSNGQIGMYGFSYQGMTQLYAAQGAVRRGLSCLKTIAPAMAGYHLYEDWAYENGALCLQLGLTWAIQLAAETARLNNRVREHHTLVAAAKHLPLYDAIPSRPDVMAGIDSFFHDWLKNPYAGSYWDKLTPQLADVDLPMLHIGGWFDPYLRGDIRLYREMAARTQPHHLCIGPWGHIPWGRKVGAADFGPEAISLIDQLQIDWFDHILKGKTWQAKSPVCLFEMGRNQWRYLAAWPQDGSRQIYFLHSDGLANIREDNGQLSVEPTGAGHDDVIVHDPWNPAPSLGGHSAIPAGVFERTAVDARGDVLTYTSAPLTEEMRVVGVVEVECAIATSALSYDLCAVLSRVKDGKVYNLTQGYLRTSVVQPPTQSPETRGAAQHSSIVRLPLHPTCFSLSADEALRLSLSAACFPAYPVNPGTGAQPDTAQLIEGNIISLAITVGGANGAQLRVPITIEPNNSNTHDASTHDSSTHDSSTHDSSTND